jgi:hypothetical protein
MRVANDCVRVLKGTEMVIAISVTASCIGIP